jgi:hypothetical protein
MSPKGKREFCGSVSVRIDTTRRKLELSPAENYGGGEGTYRVRIGRRWIDTPDGKPLFFDRDRLAGLIAARAFGEDAAPPAAAPDLPRNSRVSVAFEHNGIQQREGVFTASPPWCGYDGRWYVWVMTFAAGFIAVPADNITKVARRGYR